MQKENQFKNRPNPLKLKQKKLQLHALKNSKVQLLIHILKKNYNISCN